MPLTRRTLVGAGLLAAPFTTAKLSLSALAQAAGQANARAADPNQWFWFPGHTFCMKSTTVDTRGATAWLLAEAAPRAGVPFHKHAREDESFYVVEGTFELSVGDNTITGGPGTYAFGPREVPHRWTNIGTERGRIFNVFTPAGFEQMFYEIGLPIPSSAAPPPGIQPRSSPACQRSPPATAAPAQATSNFLNPPAPRTENRQPNLVCLNRCKSMDRNLTVNQHSDEMPSPQVIRPTIDEFVHRKTQQQSSQLRPQNLRNRRLPPASATSRPRSGPYECVSFGSRQGPPS